MLAVMVRACALMHLTCVGMFFGMHVCVANSPWDKTGRIQFEAPFDHY